VSEIKYPLLFQVPTYTTLELNYETFSSDIYILDVLEHDLTNHIQVVSLMDTLKNDLVDYLYNKYDSFECDIDLNVRADTVSEKYDDFLAGVVFELNIKSPITYCFTIA
jgi:hypothetical protein